MQHHPSSPSSSCHYPPQNSPESCCGGKSNSCSNVYITPALTKTCPVYNPKNLKCLSEACLVMGFLSIAASIATWFSASKQNSAYGERFGIFIGLWVPSFFILSHRLSQKADDLKTHSR